MTTTLFRRAALVAALGATGALAGCKDALVPDLNNPSIEGIISNPSRSQVQSMATGLLIGDRNSTGPQIRDMEIIGRDMYNLDAADPRWVTELLGTAFEAGGFGGNHWDGRYRTIKGANIMIQSVSTAEALSDEEKSAATGFAQTVKAMQLLAVAESRDVAGVAADAGASTTSLAPLLCRDPALTRIAALLDSAHTALEAGGDAFPFALPSGFEGFDTPETFAQFNRGLLAKTEIYRGKTDAGAYARALAALAESFIDTTASLDLGVYHVFSLAAGDAVNPLFQDPGTTNFRGHPSLIANAEAGDDRVAAKTEIGTNKEYQGLSSNVILTVYEGPTSPIPILRNEELILLRAQANIGAGDLAAALRDINQVRVESGGLTARGAFASQADAITELLRQKRYSLLFTSGSRLVDTRLYDRLDTLPLDDAANHVVHPNFLIPTNEQLARGGATCSAS